MTQGAARLDFLGATLVRTDGPSTAVLTANFPAACWSGFANSCAQLEATLNSTPGLGSTCPVATGGRSGCDCTVTSTTPIPTSTQNGWTDNGAGLITINTSSPFQWRTCVLPGNPDVLIIAGSDGLSTYERR